MNEPALPPVTSVSSPLPPERVQFTMRTFFAAAAWLAIGVWGQWTLILLYNSRFYYDAFFLWWSFWLWGGLWSIADVFHGRACRTAMLLGFLIMAGELLAADLVCLMHPFHRLDWRLDYLGLYLQMWGVVSWDGCLSMSLKWGLNLSVALLWGIHLGLFVGAGLAIVALAKGAMRRMWQRWRIHKSVDTNRPGSQRWLLAVLMAVGHMVVSAVLLFSVESVLRANPWPVSSLSDRIAKRVLLVGTSILDLPIALPAASLDWKRLQLPHFWSPAFLKDMDAITLYYNVLGIPLYFVLGWLIGWRLDRRTARLLAPQAEAAKPAAEEESPERLSGSCLPLRES